MKTRNKVVASEYVSMGHPDKLADTISDALLDEFVAQDHNSRCGIEVMVKDNVVVLGGEVNSKAKVDFDAIVRRQFMLEDPYNAGHVSPLYPEYNGLTPDKIKVVNLIGQQSSEIHNGVDRSEDYIGAGDQGFMVGYATNETYDYLPLGVHLAKHICQTVSMMRELGIGPDTKSQVIVRYDENGEASLDSILVSTMHVPTVSLEEVRKLVKERILLDGCGVRSELFHKYIEGRGDIIMVNPCGSWNVGGSVSDCGLTGRKIVVDHYGGYCNVGGGAFSGKDMSKVDRSGAYMARYIAKNLVASGICSQAKVELSYMIGVADPSSVNIEMDCDERTAAKAKKWVIDNVDMRPAALIRMFGYMAMRPTAVYGHFGNASYPWEGLELAEEIRNVCVSD